MKANVFFWDIPLNVKVIWAVVYICLIPMTPSCLMIYFIFLLHVYYNINNPLEYRLHSLCSSLLKFIICICFYLMSFGLFNIPITWFERATWIFDSPRNSLRSWLSARREAEGRQSWPKAVPRAVKNPYRPNQIMLLLLLLVPLHK